MILRMRRQSAPWGLHDVSPMITLKDAGVDIPALACGPCPLGPMTDLSRLRASLADFEFHQGGIVGFNDEAARCGVAIMNNWLHKTE